MSKTTYTTTVELTADDVRQILADHVGKLENKQLEPKSVEFNVDVSWTGYGPMEQQVHKFAGAKVTIHK